MKTHEFTVIASGFDPASDDFADRLYEAGCDDATISFQKGRTILSFDREAVTFSKAILTAIRNVADAGGRIERVEPDHMVSLSEIAARASMSRAAITNYHKGDRGADFPAPRAKVTSPSPLWDWQEVAEWLWRRGAIDREEAVRARIVKEVNVHMEAASGTVSDNFTERLESAERALEPA
jgi:predicted DNA-binding transcriptional regulator AlpA